MSKYLKAVICFMLGIVISAPPVLADKPLDAVFFGGSGTLGARRGFGVLGGAAHLECGTYGCYGYGLHMGKRFSELSTSFIEAGGGALILFFPVYAGLGVRMKEGKTTGGQLSLGLGAGPLFLVTRGYTEDNRLSAEFTVGLVIPIPLTKL